jgi:acyl-ACP thioesterase
MEKYTAPIGSYAYQIRPFEVDFTGKTPLTVICNYLLNSAGQHAHERRFGLDDLLPQHKAWVLSRFRVVMRQYPKRDDQVFVETWVESMQGLFTSRKFNLLDAHQQLLGSASTSWALIDWDTRRPQRIEEYVKDPPLVQHKQCLAAPPEKINITQPVQPMGTATVKYSDLDMLRHLNSVKYIQWVVDTFPVDYFEKYHLAHFQINYLAETQYGEEIELYSTREDKTWWHELKRKADHRLICRTQAVWEG